MTNIPKIIFPFLLENKPSSKEKALCLILIWIIKKSAEKDEYYHTLIENITKYGMLFPKDIENLAPKYLERGYTLEQIEDYWNTIVYEMTDEHKKGLSLFYNLAYELGETKDNGADYIDNAFIKQIL